MISAMTTRLAICTMLLVACGNGGGVDGPVCGDGVVDDGEECDDGNSARGDGCFECLNAPPVCGNGVLDFNEDCDDSNTLDGDGCSAICEQEVPPRVVNATWIFKDLQGDVTTACPAGFASIRLEVTSLDRTVTFIDTFPCADGTGTSSLIPPGQYTATVTAFDAGTMNEYATSLEEPVDISLGDDAITSTIFNDAGHFTFSWILRGQASMAVFNCTQIGAASVRAVITGTTANTTVHPCTEVSVLTVPLLAGNTYSVTLEARDSANQLIGSSIALTNQVITAPSDVTALGAIEIPLPGF
jgi:cysteine-rich repeat protein